MTSFLDLCAYLWPQWPEIAPAAVKWELLRLMGLCIGIGLGVTLIVYGIMGELNDFIARE